jgi:SAM-dependent methyltransferase
VTLNDPALVEEQYATEANLEARRALYADTEGPDPRQVLFDAVAEMQPRHVLEVGCGPGELSERIAREVDAEVVALDISARMVELARGRGVDARVGDVQALPFADASFDCAVAAWVLFHVPDLDRGLAELARVLRPGGRLLAVTNAAAHLAELRRVTGVSPWASAFSRENAEPALRRHFRVVERRDADGWITVHDPEVVRSYAASLGARAPAELDAFDVPLRARRASSVFVATR